MTTIPTCEQVTFHVNGREVRAPAGEPLLMALREIGIVVPTLCHREGLTPYGGCRICLVARRDGSSRLVSACSTPVQRNMIIETDAKDVLEARREQLKLLILDHRMECPVCERAGDCRLQDLVYEHGVEEELLRLARPHRPRDLGSSVIVRDPEKCVLCTQCVRLCEEVQGVSELAVVGRGLDSQVGTADGRRLDCEFCGQCVNACPVGAMFARPFVHSTPGWMREATTTTCSFCSCGCELTVETFDGTVQRVSSPVGGSNRGRLCAKGWLGWDASGDEERLTRPMVRRDGVLRESSWTEAIDAVVEGLKRMRGDARSAVALASPRLTSEDAYLLQRLFRTVVGSPHVGTGSAAGVRALVEGVGSSFGTTRSTATFEDLALADLVLVVGSDPTRTHPLVKTELVQGVLRRQRLVLAVPVSGGLARHADLSLALRPGTQETLLRGLACALLSESGARAATRFDGFAAWKERVSAYSSDQVSSITGVDADDVQQAARMLAAARRIVVVVVTGTGIPGDEARTTSAACEILTLLDNVQGPGSGVLVLGEKANVQGAVDAGLHPTLLPGGRQVSSSEDQEACQAVWDAPVPGEPGWSGPVIRQRLENGEVGFLYLVGHDLDRVSPSRSNGDGADDDVFMVVQDPFLTPAARAADVVLPVALLLERTGHVTAADGTPRRLRRAVPPPSDLPQDGQVFAEIAERLGTPIPTGPALRTEMRRLSRDPARSQVRPRFAPPEPPPPPRDAVPLTLDLSPRLFHSGSTTMHSTSLTELAPPVSVYVAPTDAARLGISDGTTVRVIEGEHRLLLSASVDDDLRHGTVGILPQTLKKHGVWVDSDDPVPRQVTLEVV